MARYQRWAGVWLRGRRVQVTDLQKFWGWFWVGCGRWICKARRVEDGRRICKLGRRGSRRRICKVGGLSRLVVEGSFGVWLLRAGGGWATGGVWWLLRLRYWSSSQFLFLIYWACGFCTPFQYVATFTKSSIVHPRSAARAADCPFFSSVRICHHLRHGQQLCLQRHRRRAVPWLYRRRYGDELESEFRYRKLDGADRLEFVE